VTVTFRRRESAFEDGERELIAAADGLTERRPGRYGRNLAWDRVASVRVSPAGTRLKPWRWTASIRFEGGEAVAFDNGHFLGVGRFEDRSTEFSAFIREAVARTEAARPQAAFFLGGEPGAYLVQVLIGLSGLALAAAAVILLPLGAWPPVLIAKAVLLALLVWPTLNWIGAARPRKTTAEGLLAELP